MGARPQFIKHAPVSKELKKHFVLKTIHTGQHYDFRLSEIFFKELNMDEPDFLLKIGSHTHGIQTGLMLMEIEKVLLIEKPKVVLVYGDTNSTLAGAIAASKLGILIAHVEAGLRGFNRDLPEEINRILTDHVSTFLFAPTKNSVQNLKNEGIVENVFLCGDVMLDSILLAKKLIGNVEEGNFYLVTLHRPYNTDSIERLISILDTINELHFPSVFPIHPRTRVKLEENGIDISKYFNVKFVPPTSYLELVRLQMQAKAVITDSGGVQKEAYILGKRCITLRKETEWGETLIGNWNYLIFNNLEMIGEALKLPLSHYNRGLFGDGKASQFIANRILNGISRSDI